MLEGYLASDLASSLNLTFSELGGLRFIFWNRVPQPFIQLIILSELDAIFATAVESSLNDGFSPFPGVCEQPCLPAGWPPCMSDVCRAHGLTPKLQHWVHVATIWDWCPGSSQSPCPTGHPVTPLIKSGPLPKGWDKCNALLRLTNPGCLHLTYAKRTGLHREVSLIIDAEERQSQIP